MNSSLTELDRYLVYFNNLPLEDLEDHLEAEYFSKEVLASFYKLEWSTISEDKLNLFYYQFSNLQEIIIQFIYGEDNEDNFCKMARENKRSRAEKLRNDIETFLMKKKD